MAMCEVRVRHNSRKISTTVYLTNLQAISLKKIKERSGIPEARIIREGLDIAIKIYLDKLEALGQLKPEEREHIRKAAAKIDILLDEILT